MADTCHQHGYFQFVVGDRRFEAVAISANGGVNGNAIGYEDETYLQNHLESLPAYLQCYNLLTGRHDDMDPRYVFFFYWFAGKWNRDLAWPRFFVNDVRWLVLRRY